MRVLIVSVAEKTNFLNMVPLGWALRAAGHEVRVASQPDLMPTASDTGLPSVPVGRDHNFWRIMRMFRAPGATDSEVPLFRQTVGPLKEIGWERLRNGYREVVPWWWRTVNDPMVNDLVDLCRQWKPDLVIWEPIALAAPIAAEAVGAVHARFLWGVDLLGAMRSRYLQVMEQQPPGEREDPLADWLGSHARRLGGDFTERMTSGYFTIDYLPSALRLPEPAQVRYEPMRYIPYNGRSTLPAWLRTPPERTRVCLTLGTSATERQGGYSLPVADILDGLADLDAEIIATLPRTERERLGPLPPNVRPVEFAPLHALAETCSAVINHGGAGTVLSMLDHGVPQVIVPRMQFDEKLLAAGVGRAGAARVLTGTEVGAAEVRAALDEVLTEPGHALGAAEAQRTMRALPSPNEMVGTLAGIVACGGGAPVPSTHASHTVV